MAVPHPTTGETVGRWYACTISGRAAIENQLRLDALNSVAIANQSQLGALKKAAIENQLQLGGDNERRLQLRVLVQIY